MPRLTLMVAFSITMCTPVSLFANSTEHRPAAVVPNSELRRSNEKVSREFNAVILKSLLDPIMTRVGGSMGLGKAGRHWQSLMSEHLARHIADSRQLNLLEQRTGSARTRHGTTMAPLGTVGSCTERECGKGGLWRTLVVRNPALPQPILSEQSRAVSENPHWRKD